MKMTISRFSAKEITTSRGIATVLNFQANGRWYSSFRGTWKEHWQEGAVIDIDPGQIKERTKNGKTYLNIAAPTKPQASNGAAKERVVNALIEIHKDLQLIKKHLGIEQE